MISSFNLCPLICITQQVGYFHIGYLQLNLYLTKILSFQGHSQHFKPHYLCVLDLESVDLFVLHFTNNNVGCVLDFATIKLHPYFDTMLNFFILFSFCYCS